jgi:hypothetical protein
MSKPTNPSKHPLGSNPKFDPPERLVRPRNGERTSDALGTEAISGHDGGGKVRDPFIPLADRPQPKDRLNIHSAEEPAR